MPGGAAAEWYMSSGSDDYANASEVTVVDINHELLVNIPEFLPRLVKLLKLQSNHVPFGHGATQQILHNLPIPDALLPLLEVTDSREDWDSEEGLNLEHMQLWLRDTVENDAGTSNTNELRDSNVEMSAQQAVAGENNSIDNRALHLSGLKACRSLHDLLLQDAGHSPR